MSSASSQLGRPVGTKSEVTRRRILDAAMRCVGEVGYSRATIREIARYADITSGSLYHYFPNKAELVKAAFMEIAQVSLPRLAAAADRAEGVLDKLLAVFDEGAAVLYENPHSVAFDRALRMENAEHLHLSENSDVIFTSLHSVITGIVEQAAEEGILNTDIDGATDAIFTVLRGLHDHAATATPEQYEATHHAVRMLIQGSLFSFPRHSSGHSTRPGQGSATSGA
ncbi:MAG TPA: TetR/AcrR family transcriptional regulator [Rhodococcus sp. (in: high G+C Gram-positive bacteria)]|uniref:TetR/AcrR family transcriptional regulator n=1 Tax=Rhodococcus sp. SMB37 TaxID=2512213 RepID=UPI000A8324D8|nr:TetR/AcrR family transcriptional regulator [Rhodococcus sp. SMB37]TCN55760.1 TetR family transcriptional regulator [Rhodococcus sp. SMB37]HET8992269.1 TetR/AcrR family transcriptional regulator [Rhodococcus sp. (in: high G+C Gram-positive bacteria)]